MMSVFFKRVLLAISALALTPSAAEAFCGFYVSGQEGSLQNSATMVVVTKLLITIESLLNNDRDSPGRRS